MATKQGKRNFSLFLALALFFHVIFTSLIFIAPRSRLNDKKEVKHTAQVIFVSPQKKSKTLVQTFVPENNIIPDKSLFLAEKNNSVAKESLRYGNSKATTSKFSQSFPKLQSKSKPEDFNGQKGHKTNDPLGIYQAQQLPKFISQSTEYVRDVEQGAETVLNTIQYQHATFFNRLKDKVAKNWAPDKQIAKYDPYGKVLGEEERITVLNVTINAKGELTKMAVMRSSGFSFLDEEAVMAFNIAAPFSYPPKELFSKNQSFSFDFSFYVKADRGFGLQWSW